MSARLALGHDAGRRLPVPATETGSTISFTVGTDGATRVRLSAVGWNWREASGGPDEFGEEGRA